MLKTIQRFVRRVLDKIKKKMKGQLPFSSADYWNARYKDGGNSGAGSYGRLAEFKAEIINDLIKKYSVPLVIEFGCGDGNQLSLLDCPQYFGIDVSSDILEKITKKYANDPMKRFVLLNDYSGEQADLVLSLDVIYHLIEDSVFHEYMQTLFAASNRLVCIYASNEDTLIAAVHVRHRTFTDWIAKNQSEWKLLEYIPNRYPFDENHPAETSFADFYIFTKS